MEKPSNSLARGILGDVKFGLRTLSRSPLFSLCAILTLALGIGATTTVRLAIGSSRGRLVRLLLTESLLLGIGGGIVGFGFGYEGCRLFWNFRPPDVARNLVDPKLGAQVLLTNFQIDGIGAYGSAIVYLDELTVTRW
jgi:hypothetical protein